MNFFKKAALVAAVTTASISGAYAETLRAEGGSAAGLSALVPQLLSNYASDDHEIRVNVDQTLTRAALKVATGAIDLASTPAELRLHEESLVQNIVFPDELVIVAGAKSELAKNGVIATKEKLEQARWVIAGARAGIHGTETEIFQFLGIEPKIQNISISGDLMIPMHLLRTTDALMALPKNLIGLFGDLGAAKIVQSDFPPIRRDIALWFRKLDQNRVDLLDFAGRLEAYLKEVNKCN